MPKAILHIGQHKTGTSATQHFMREHREFLAQQGLFVPTTGFAIAHHALARAISGLKFDPTRRPNLLNRLKNELKENGDPDILISSESMSMMMLSKVVIERFKSYFNELGYSLVVVLFVRSPVALLNSGYSQRVKSFVCADTIGGYLRNKLSKGQNWAALRRDKDIQHIIVPYNQSVRRVGAERALLDALGISAELPALSAKINVAPGPNEIYVIQRFVARQLAVDYRFTVHERRQLKAASKNIDFKDTAGYWGMTGDLISKIEAMRLELIEELALAEWGMTLDECFPGEFSSTRAINDLYQVPPADVDWELIKALDSELDQAMELIKQTPNDEPERYGTSVIERLRQEDLL